MKKIHLERRAKTRKQRGAEKMLLTGPKEHLNDVSSVRDFGRMGRRLSVSKISFKLKTTSE